MTLDDFRQACDDFGYQYTQFSPPSSHMWTLRDKEYPYAAKEITIYQIAGLSVEDFIKDWLVLEYTV